MDRISPLLDRFSLKANVVHAGALRGNNRFGGGPEAAQLHLLREGVARLRVGTARPVGINQPSLIWLPHATEHRLEIDTKADVLCARISFGSGQTNPLIRAMPPALVLPLARLDSLDGTIELLFQEAFQKRCGRQAVADRLCEVLLIQLIRHCIADGVIGSSVIAGLSDPRLARAITAMHARPQHNWTLESLAETAGMSRARFAAHFKSAVGVPPGAYLSDWRLGLARTLLLRGHTVKGVASEIGYRSTRAFARVFALKHGTPPRHWLSRQAGIDPAA